MNKVEQVAMAIYDKDPRSGAWCDFDDLNEGDPTKAVFMGMARAAIEAMKKPTNDMTCTGDDEILAYLNSERIVKGINTPAYDCFNAMLDAALEEAGE